MCYKFESGIVLLLFIVLVSSYEIPDVRVESNAKGFRLAIPDESGINAVFYIMKINDKCPAIINYLSEAKDNKWISDWIDKKLSNDDKLEIAIIVEFANEVIQKYEEKLFKYQGQSRTITKAVSENEINLFKQCDDLEDSKDVLLCRPTISSSSTKLDVKCRGEVILEDNFDTFNDQVWKHEIRSRVQSNDAELVAYDNRPENYYVKNGLLHIKPTWSNEIRYQTYDVWDRCTSVEKSFSKKSAECNYRYPSWNSSIVYPPIFSAKIHNRDSFSFKYGRVEIRAKLPIGNWLFPNIILQPKSSATEDSYINYTRIAYARGNPYLMSGEENIGGRILCSDVLFWDTKNIEKSSIKLKFKSNQHFGSDFHTYALVWQKNRLSFEIDGMQYGTISTADLEPFNNEEFFIVIGLTVGGVDNFNANINDPLSKSIASQTHNYVVEFWKERENIEKTWEDSELKVDYVRVTAI